MPRLSQIHEAHHILSREDVTMIHHRYPRRLQRVRNRPHDREMGWTDGKHWPTLGRSLNCWYPEPEGVLCNNNLTYNQSSWAHSELHCSKQWNCSVCSTALLRRGAGRGGPPAGGGGGGRGRRRPRGRG